MVNPINNSLARLLLFMFWSGLSVFYAIAFIVFLLTLDWFWILLSPIFLAICLYFAYGNYKAYMKLDM